MIEEESKSKDQLINDLINELNSLKEANGLALSLMTPEQREKYDKVESLTFSGEVKPVLGTSKPIENAACAAGRAPETGKPERSSPEPATERTSAEPNRAASDKREQASTKNNSAKDERQSEQDSSERESKRE